MVQAERTPSYDRGSGQRVPHHLAVDHEDDHLGDVGRVVGHPLEEARNEDQPDGSALVKGTLFQEKAPQNWVMPLPLIFRLPGDQVARGTVAAIGPTTPVQIKLPKRPTKVELDPDVWVISEKTETKAK